MTKRHVLEQRLLDMQRCDAANSLLNSALHAVQSRCVAINTHNKHYFVDAPKIHRSRTDDAIFTFHRPLDNAMRFATRVQYDRHSIVDG